MLAEYSHQRISAALVESIVNAVMMVERRAMVWGQEVARVWYFGMNVLN
jgi:hypothetical protein